MSLNTTGNWFTKIQQKNSKTKEFEDFAYEEIKRSQDMKKQILCLLELKTVSQVVFLNKKQRNEIKYLTWNTSCIHKRKLEVVLRIAINEQENWKIKKPLKLPPPMNHGTGEMKSMVQTLM